MRTAAVLLILLLSSAWAVGQGLPPAAAADMLFFQQPAPPPPLPGAGNVVFRTERIGDKVTMGYFAIADSGKTVTNAPYTATATTETTQVLSDGNRIVNKTEALLARDSQGRTRRQETMGNIGPLATNAPKMVFITDPLAKANYILDLNDKTAEVMNFHGGSVAPGPPGPGEIKIIRKQGTPGATTVNVEKKVTMGGAGSGVEQHVWVNTPDEASQVKTESLGTQTIEGVSAEGTRTTRTIPAGQIGNERPLEITSEVWTSPDLQMIILSKRNDPRFGETVYKLTDIKRADPDPSLFQVPNGFTTRSPGDSTAPEPK